MSIIKTYEINGITVNEHIVDVELATDLLKQDRLNICNTCDKRNDNTCSECSCLLTVRVSYTDSFCPIGKW